MKKMLLGLLAGLFVFPTIASATTDASETEFSWSYDEVSTFPGVGVFADTIYLMSDGIPSPSITENAKLVATYTSDDTLTFAKDQTSYLFGGATSDSTIVVDGNNTINVLLNQKYTITGEGTLTVDSYGSYEQLKDEAGNLLFNVFYYYGETASGTPQSIMLKDENGDPLIVSKEEGIESIFEELKEYNEGLDGAIYNENDVLYTSVAGWSIYDIDEAWVSEHITSDKVVTYNEDGSVTFSDGNVLTSDNVIFESSENFDESYKLESIDILDNASEELKNEVANQNKVLLALYDISVVGGNSEVVPMENGTFTIKIKLTDAMKEYNTLTAAYILDGKIVETFNTTIDGEYVVFNTTHLSEYAILGENTVTDETVENPSTGDNVMQYAIVLCLSAIGIGYAAYTLRKEN